MNAMSLSSDFKKQYPLKLLGIDNTICSNEDVLEFLELYIPPSSISYLHFDSFQKFYVVFLNDIESVCTLVGKRLSCSGCKVDILPLLDYYIVRNVYPDLTNEDIVDLFRPFGNVYNVRVHRVLPNSSKFCHVLSGNREVSFMLPSYEIGVSVPGSVVYLPYTFHVIKYCPACTTEGHAMLRCPDIEDSCLPLMTSAATVSMESDLELKNFSEEDLISDGDYTLQVGSENEEQSNGEKYSNGEEKSSGEEQSNDEQQLTDEEQSSAEEQSNVIYFVKRKCKMKKGLERCDRMNVNSKENVKRGRKKKKSRRKWGKACLVRVRPTEVPEVSQQTPSLQQDKTEKKCLKRGRPRKHPSLLLPSGIAEESIGAFVKRGRLGRKSKDWDKTSFLHQKINEKAFVKRRKLERNPENSDQTPLLHQKIKGKTFLKRGRPKRNPGDLDQEIKEILHQKIKEKKRGRPKRNAEDSDQTSLLHLKIKEKTFLKRGRPKKNCGYSNQTSFPPEKIKEKAFVKRGKLERNSEHLDQASFLHQKMKEKTFLKRGRPKKNPGVSDQTYLLYQEIKKKSFIKRGRLEKNSEYSDQTSFLLQKIKEKTFVKRGSRKINPDSLDQTTLQHQEIEEKSSDEEENCCTNFSLHPSLEKIVQNAEGILPIFVLKRLLLMDLRNKKDIITYVSKYTSDFDQVFQQFKKLQWQTKRNDDFYLTRQRNFQRKLFILINTLLRKIEITTNHFE